MFLLNKIFMYCYYFLILILGASSFYTSNAYADKVGIIGDMHGEKDSFINALKQMKEQGVEHVICTGDYVGVDVTMIKKTLGIPNENIHFTIGNWDEYASNIDISEYLSQHGRVINPNNCGESGIVNIDGKNIMVAHFPQHKLPIAAAPDVDQNYPIFNQIMNIDTMNFDDYPPPAVDLEIFAHTHKVASFVYENETKENRTRVINPGALIKDKASVNPLTGKKTSSFVIYDTKKNNVDFIDIDENKTYKTFTTDKPSLMKETDAFNPHNGNGSSIWKCLLEKNGFKADLNIKANHIPIIKKLPKLTTSSSTSSVAINSSESDKPKVQIILDLKPLCDSTQLGQINHLSSQIASLHD